LTHLERIDYARLPKFALSLKPKQYKTVGTLLKMSNEWKRRRRRRRRRRITKKI